MYVRLTAARNHSSISISQSANCIVISSCTQSQVTQKISILIPLRIYGFQRTPWVYYTSYEYILTDHKKARGNEFDSPPCDFFKNELFRERVEPCFFVTFSIIISHIFSENFIKNSQVFQKISRSSCSIFFLFCQFYEYFDISMLRRNWWGQHTTDSISIFLHSTYSKKVI